MDITQFRTNGLTPFVNHSDAAEGRLREAHALAELLADAAGERVSIFGEVPGELLYSAFAGIAHLIAYAQYHLEAEAMQKIGSAAA